MLSHHQCARDLVEEFCYAKVAPLRLSEKWFQVADEAGDQNRGLKIPVVDF